MLSPSAVGYQGLVHLVGQFHRTQIVADPGRPRRRGSVRHRGRRKHAAGGRRTGCARAGPRRATLIILPKWLTARDRAPPRLGEPGRAGRGRRRRRAPWACRLRNAARPAAGQQARRRRTFSTGSAVPVPASPQVIEGRRPDPAACRCPRRRRPGRADRRPAPLRRRRSRSAQQSRPRRSRASRAPRSPCSTGSTRPTRRRQFRPSATTADDAPREPAEPAPPRLRAALPGDDPGALRRRLARRPARRVPLRPAAARGARDRARQGGPGREQRRPDPAGAARSAARRGLCRRRPPGRRARRRRPAGAAAARRSTPISTGCRTATAPDSPRWRPTCVGPATATSWSPPRARSFHGRRTSSGECDRRQSPRRRDPARRGPRHRRPGRDGRADADRPVLLGPHPARRPAGHGQDLPRPVLRARARARLRAHPVHPRPDAGRHPRLQPVQLPDQPVHPDPRARSSASCCSPTRSTAPRPRPRPPCSRRCRSAPSPSTARPTACPTTSW